MATYASAGGRARVLIAGGGFAAVEAALALRALAGDRVTVVMVAPGVVFRYRPAATSEAFDVAPSRCYDLRAIAGDLGVDYHDSRLEAVASQKHFVRTAKGARLGYDALILATGARGVIGVPGAITFRDQRDVRLIRRVLAELEAGAVRKMVFALPTGSVWPVPLYELALLSAKHARECRLRIATTLVSPEREPLALFGTRSSQLIRGLLGQRGVRFIGGTVAANVQRGGSLALANDGTIEADRVVALPELRGRRITGVPAGRAGFIPVDESGRVDRLQDVYAAGDATTFPIKHGGLAAQQADVVAHTIAESLGVAIKAVREQPVVLARVLGGERPVFLRAEFDWRGQPARGTLVRTDDERAAKSAKVHGRYLVPSLETREPLAD